MRKIFTSFMLLSAMLVSASTPRYFTIRNTDGSAHSHAISEIRKVVFGTGQSGNLAVYGKNKSTVSQYPYQTLDCLTFDENEAGIIDVFTDENTLKVSYDPQSQSVEVVASETIEMIQLYGINGNIITTLTPGNVNASLSLADVLPGLYIVKAVTDNHSVTEKIVKR